MPEALSRVRIPPRLKHGGNLVTQASMLETEQRLEAEVKTLRREIDSLRAQVKDQTSRLMALRAPVAVPDCVPAWAAGFERRLDLVASQVAVLTGLLEPRFRKRRRVAEAMGLE